MPIAVYALALASFAIGTAEFVIAGILPQLADGLGVEIPTAGLLVSAYAIGVAIGGPLLTLWTARFPPRNVILVVMVGFAIAQVLCALAPDYGLLLVARLFSAAAHGVFFGAGSVVVARLVPAERRGGALALFIGGITVANLLGLPGGTAIGLAWGWRTTFLAVGLMGAFAMVVLVLKLPVTPAEDHRSATIRAQVAALRHQRVWMSYLAIGITMVGVLIFGTYQVPMLLKVTGIDAGTVPLYQLLAGIGSVIGIYLGGRAADWRPMPATVAALVLQALLFLAIATFAMHDPLLMAASMFFGGAAGFAFSTPLQARIIHAAREAPDLAAALISTAFNIGIAGGAALGALLLEHGTRLEDLPLVGIGTALLAALVCGISWHLDRREARAALPA